MLPSNSKSYITTSGSIVRIKDILSDIEKKQAEMLRLIADECPDPNVYDKLITSIMVSLQVLNRESSDTIDELINIINETNKNKDSKKPDMSLIIQY